MDTRSRDAIMVCAYDMGFISHSGTVIGFGSPKVRAAASTWARKPIGVSSAML
ncbi:hypothetical protein ACIQXA_05670 [Streptomyces massasporeus]|uniref:hypothetical protein n=1 Tax=Streptomyces massasporeus TaxID=67324 RepID=UPI003810E1C9